MVRVPRSAYSALADVAKGTSGLVAPEVARLYRYSYFSGDNRYSDTLLGDFVNNRGLKPFGLFQGDSWVCPIFMFPHNRLRIFNGTPHSFSSVLEVELPRQPGWVIDIREVDEGNYFYLRRLLRGTPGINVSSYNPENDYEIGTIDTDAGEIRNITRFSGSDITVLLNSGREPVVTDMALSYSDEPAIDVLYGNWVNHDVVTLSVNNSGLPSC